MHELDFKKFLFLFWTYDKALIEVFFLVRGRRRILYTHLFLNFPYWRINDVANIV